MNRFYPGRPVYDQSGVANFVVFVLIMLVCAGLIITLVLAGRLNTIRAEIRQVEKNTAAVQSEISVIANHLSDVSPLIMKVPELQAVNLEDIEKYLFEKQKSYYFMSGVFLDEYDTKDYQEWPKKGYDFTMETILRNASEKLALTGLYFRRFNHEREIQVGRLPGFNKVLLDVQQQKDREIQELNTHAVLLNNIIEQETGKYASLEKELSERDRILDEQLPVLQEKFKTEENKLKNKILQLKQEIEQLAVRETVSYHTIESQGRIINPDISGAFAFIDLGKNDNIKLGMKFRVFREAENVKIRWKGQVEVKKIFDTYSQVSVTQLLNPLDPITEGDGINNIFYAADGVKFVALIGTFQRGDFQYDREEIKRRLEKLGVAAENDCSLKTDFVLMGQMIDSLTEIKIKKLGIPRIEGPEAREAVLYYLGD